MISRHITFAAAVNRAVLLFVVVLGAAGLLALPASVAFADVPHDSGPVDASTVDVLASYCDDQLPDNLDSACAIDNNQYVVYARNVAEQQCTDKAATQKDPNRQYDCIIQNAENYIDYAASHFQGAASPGDFANEFKAYLQTKGNINQETSQAKQSLPPQSDCASSDCGSDPAIAGCTNQNCNFIGKYVNPFIDLLSVCFGFVAVISIVMGGIQYSASNGDAQKVTLAKKRIIDTMIAVVAYFFLYGFLEFLIPGGVFR